MTLPFDRDQVLKKNPKITPAQLAAFAQMLRGMESAGLSPFQSQYRLDPPLGTTMRTSERSSSPLLHRSQHAERK